ncbi:sensor histidine kinase [Paenibacillus riograndensis]|uniref:histidine kinase n=3 Tax=Paenibacillus riograndensis TaxID=483937 RepID=A0A0E4HAL6_9BACL|nr:histidine kinase [Paenibacillus riograndensis]KWX86831.1 histidine kinase [Paenibacillus riograndensis]CQR55035.1 ATPase/histidine kinase/DNA gyrase B/HSP90 domain protein [Paenibacillus riograndensis SBR5]
MSAKLKLIMNYLQQATMKKRIMFIFASATLIPFICVVLLSYHTMSSILAGNLESSVRSNLKQAELSLERTISNLNHVSQQLALQGSIGKKVDLLLSSDKQFERAVLTEEINTEINLISFTNPTIGLMMYYSKVKGTYMFNSTIVKEDYEITGLPLLAEYFRISYFGPHISNERYNDEYVISALRKVDLPGDPDDMYVYVESGFKMTPSIFEDNQEDASYYLILDNDKRIAYSDVPEDFAMDDYFADSGSSGDAGLQNGYYWFESTSNQGWSVISLIPVNEYNQQKNRWVIQMIYLFLLFLAVSLLIAWFLWKMVYVPLQQFNHQIKSIAQRNTAVTEVTRIKIPEFDFLLKQLQNMKNQIAELIQEVEVKEKGRADLEVEKLLYQINPHFLMNTLDTVHWLAVMNGQKDIDKLVVSLNKLLYYNLGKRGLVSTIREEIDSIRQYLTLQQVRYDFGFDVRIHVDDDVLELPIPRFILQPVLENSLYHGLHDEGYIQVEVGKEEGQIIISVYDNGAGISAEEIAKLLHQQQVEQQKAGMGIGMSYVKRMIENQYGGLASLEIHSELGQGTTVFLKLPSMEVLPND